MTRASAHLVDDPVSLEEIFQRDRSLHIYGLGDLREPFWTPSSWYRKADAVAGVVRLPEGDAVGYAMAIGDAINPTLALFADVQAELPAGSLVVGAAGLSASLRDLRRHTPLGTHLRMIRTASVDVDHKGTVPLTVADIPALADLRARQPDEAFFLHHMIELGVFRGVFDGTDLVAVAGTHLVDEVHGVAALGSVVTRSDHRGRGLARRTTAAVVADVVDRLGDGALVGLNVKADNTPAIGLYEQLGFEAYCDYEEVVLGSVT